MLKLRRIIGVGGYCRFKKMYFIIKSLHEILQDEKNNEEFQEFAKHYKFLENSHNALRPIFGKHKFKITYWLLPKKVLIKRMVKSRNKFHAIFLSDEKKIASNCISMFTALKRSDIRTEALDLLKKDFQSLEENNTTKEEFAESFLRRMEFFSY